VGVDPDWKRGQLIVAGAPAKYPSLWGWRKLA